MSTVRTTLRWLLVLLILIGSVGGFYAYSLWRKQDELLTQSIVASLAQKLPHWDINIGRARFDWSRRVHIYDTVIRDRQGRLLAKAPEIVIVVDSETLTAEQTVAIEKVDVRNPEVHLLRSEDGSWNYEDLLPLPPSQASLPDWTVSNANIFVRMAHESADPTQLGITDLSGQFAASGKRRFTFDIQLGLRGIGDLELGGEWDLDRKEWTVSGQIPHLTVNEELIENLSRTHPLVRDQLASTDARLAEYFSQLPGGTIDAGRDTGHPSRGTSTDPRLGIAGKTEIDFRVTQWGPDKPLEYKALVQLSQMQVTNAHLPLPLHDVVGKFYFDQNQVLIRDLTARNGVTTVGCSASVVFGEPGPVCDFDITAQDVVLDQRLYELLPQSWRKIYDSLQPSGHADLSCRLTRDAGGRWKAIGGRLSPKNCTVAHRKFPYPIRRVQGFIQQREDKLDFDYRLKGAASGRDVFLTGYTLDAGPLAESLFTVDIAGLPIDSTLKAACLPQVRETLDAMRLEGVADLKASFFRPAGYGQKFRQKLTAELRDGAIQAKFFPLRLDQLSGKITFSSETSTWTFSDLKAHHGHAVVQGGGLFTSRKAPGDLDLSLTIRGAHFDKSLELALGKPMQRLWDSLSPSGRFHALTKIHWRPGRPVDVALPVIKVYDAGLVLEGFPVPLSDVEAHLAFAGNRLEINSFRARHDHTRVRASGYATVDVDQWRVRLEEIFIDDLVPDRVFRLALPESLRSAVEQLDPRGELSLSGMLDFRGTGPPQDQLTAAWDVSVVCSGNSIYAGLPLEGVRGRVTAYGVYDGNSVRNEGRINLDSVVILDHQITDIVGPYRINDEQLVVGSKKILSPNPGSVPLDERIIGNAIGGRLSLDAVAVLGDRPSFRLIGSISDGSLEEYSRLYIPGENTLRGVVNGWIDLHGRAEAQQEISEESMTGRGQLKISPAALYELPVIVQIFKVLSFVPPDRTAFNYAQVDFDVNRGAFWFQSIDLVGDAISLRGKGTARFDGKLDLDFYSMLGRNANPRLPVFDVLINTATTGWVGVEVDGYVGSPRAKLKVAPTIDDTLRRFLGSFDTRGRNGTRLRLPLLRPEQQSEKLNETAIR